MNHSDTIDFGSAPFSIIDGDRGKNYPKQGEFSESGFCLFLNATNVTRNGFDFTKCQFISEQKDNALRKGKLQRDDVVLTTRGTVGNAAFVNSSVPYEHMRINSGMVILRCDKNKIVPSYVYHYLRSPQFHGQVNSLRTGVAQPQLPIRDMRHIKLPLPKVPIQKAISSILSAYDDLIENNRRRIQLLEQAARLLYKEWFVHLRFPGHKDVKIKDDVPEGWERKTAFDVMEVLSGGTPKTDVAEYWDGDIPFFTPKDALDSAYVFNTEKTLTEMGLKNCNSRLYPKDTIFITARGTVGNVKLAGVPMAMNQSCYALIGKAPLNQRFLYFSLLESVEQFRNRAVGSVFDAIIRDTFKLIPFGLPDEKLIRLFTNYAAPILEQIHILIKQSQELAKGRDLLLTRLMNGEIPV
jgi:type I restriction enzyme, S subunit